jgi:hypothetical protein
MRTKHTFFTMAFFLMSGWICAHSPSPFPPATSPILPKQHIGWMKNQGQQDSNCQFNTFSHGGQVILNKEGNIIYFLSDENGKAIDFRENFQSSKLEKRTAKGLDTQTTKVNYIKGNYAKSIKAIPCYKALDLGEMWPKITVQLRKAHHSVEKVFFP